MEWRDLFFFFCQVRAVNAFISVSFDAPKDFLHYFYIPDITAINGSKLYSRCS